MTKGGINVNLNLVWKIAAVIFFLGAAYQMLWKMEPEVTKNTEHRIKFEERVTTMQADIALILQKVSKNE